ncbi:MAG TPA: hypothetical protein VF143_11195 [Candidatus Nanopelagicales bacterium]
MANLALADVVLPYVLRGENLGPSHAALSALRVVTFETSTDALGVTLRGRCEVNGRLQLDPAAGTLSASVDEATPAHDPSRSDPIFDLRDTTVDFELFVPRAGSAIVAAAQPTFGAGAAGTAALFSDWGAATPADYPSTGFVLDLILTAPRLRPPFLHPAKVSAIGVLEPDPSFQEVALTLPRLRFRIAHGNPNPSQLSLSLVAAGVSNLDDPGSTEVSELISMEPPYAYVGGANDRVVGFGFRSATLDLDREWTPPALAQKTGIGDDWTGLYLPEARVFVAPDGLRNLAFECGAQELLIGVGRTAGLWGDFEAALVQQGSGELTINPRFDAGVVGQGGRSYPVTPGGVTGGVRQATARVPERSTLIVDVSGGRTPYQRTVTINGAARPSATMYDLDLSATGTATIDLEVRSGSPTTPPARMHIVVTRLQDAPMLAVPGQPIVNPQAAVIDAQSGFTFALEQGSASASDVVTVRTLPPDPRLVWTVSGGAASAPTAAVSTSVPGGTSKTYAVTRPGSTGPTTLPYYFFFDCPGAGGSTAMATEPAVDKLHQTWSAGAQDPATAYRQQLEDLPDESTLTIVGDASYEDDLDEVGYNTSLAWRRAQAVRTAIDTQFPAKKFKFDIKPLLANPQLPTPAEQAAWSALVGWPTHGAPNDRQHWAATVSFSGATAATNGSVTVRRPAPTSTPTTVLRPPPDPPVPETSPPPDWFRSVKVKVRVVDSQLIAVQLDLEVDFQTLTEDKLAGQLGSAPAGTTIPRGRTLQNGTPVGPDNPADGITLFRVLVQTDPATGRFDTLLSAGADPADKDGLLHFGWIPQVDPMPASKDVGLTFLGSYLSFWPLLAAAPPVDAVRGAAEGREGAVVDAVLAGTALAVPGVVAALPWFMIERVILFGAEYFHTQVDDGFTGTFLVDVEMDWSIDLLGIVTIPRDKPLKVRYKAIGIRLTNRDVPPDAPPGTPAPDRWDLLPVFDASRGYTIDVAGGGGGMQIGDPLGKILRIAGARLSRSNPMTLEVDIALGVDLGVVSVDQASVRAYLDGSAPPELTALSASVDIPGALVGSGYLRIGTAADGVTKTIGGQIDLTIRPVSVRIAAAVEIANIVDGARTATGVYVGLNVVLPAGIPLGSTGIGIFGFRGIFGMHYRRTELSHPSTSVPALAWLKHAEGQPHLLKAPGSGPVLWEPRIDNWAFGIGILIGTMEGGVILNLDGTFLLELPGPRVLIMMNARIISPPPSVGELGMKAGILAVIEITPDHFLIGILVQWEIEDLVKIVIPIEAVFPFGTEAHRWHIYLGARRDYGASVEVDVLGIVKGTGYLMFRGDGVNAFAAHGATLPALQGFAIGLGVGASFVWGDKSSGLYLSVGGGMDAVLGFSPFTLAGNIWVAGELRLWIVSVGADANLEVVVAEQPGGDLSLYIHGRACGHVELLFFEVSGCVDITISEPKKSAAIPQLLEKVSLQARSPALAQGTGVDRGIDVSLAQAVQGDTYPGDGAVPVVPIDAIPVLSFLVPPSPDGAVTIGGLNTPLEAANGVDAAGYAERSGDRYRYRIVDLRLERIDSGGAVEAVTLTSGDAPASWWTIAGATDASPNAQLAMLTYQVTPATKALEYTDRLVEDVTRRWGTVCDPAAPAAEVLWTFKLEPLGPCATGWDLEGIAWPDPAGTHRGSPVATGLHVSEPWRTGDPTIDGLRGVVPAYVLGGVVACQRRQRLPALGALTGVRARVVREGLGPVDAARPSGELLADQDPVGRLLAPTALSRDLRISAALYDKASAALPGLRALTARGETGYSVEALLRDTAAGTPVTGDLMALGLARSVITPAAAADLPRTGARCPVKALVAPQRDYGAASSFFRDEEALRQLKRAKVRDGERELANLVRLHTGGFAAMGVLLMLPLARGTRFDPVTAIVRDASGAELGRVTVAASDFLVNGQVLPPEWTDLGGPWGNDVSDLVAYAAQLKLEPAFLELARFPDADHVDLGQDFAQSKVLAGLAEGRDVAGLDRYLIAAMSMLTMAEVTRADWDQTQRDADKQRLVKATGPGASNYALLKADSRYRIVVDWYADRLGDPTPLGSAATPQRQTAWFRTDRVVIDPTDATERIFNDRLGQPLAEAPTRVRLDPWVMLSMPEDDELSTFGHEPLRIVFNTPDVDRIFAEYGKELRVRLSAANGQHPDDTTTIAPSTLSVVPGVLKSPWHHAVDTMLEQGIEVVLPDGSRTRRPAAPCVAVDAASSAHSVLDIPVPLHPFMGYLLDVELVDAGAPQGARGPRVFRRHFTTGGFGTMGALAWSVSSTLPSAQYAAPGTFASLLAGLGTRPEGAALDEHLRSHDLAPWPAPDRARVVVFWEQAGTAAAQPAAVLIDATEALSRTRDYPLNVTDTTVANPPQRWVLAPREWLTVRTGGDAGLVDGIVFAPGSQRAIVVLKPGARGKHLTADLVSQAMPDLPFLDTGEHAERLVDLSFPHAPWEEPT